MPTQLIKPENGLNRGLGISVTIRQNGNQGIQDKWQRHICVKCEEGQIYKNHKHMPKNIDSKDICKKYRIKLREIKLKTNVNCCN